jgi:hypothetical protein
MQANVTQFHQLATRPMHALILPGPARVFHVNHATIFAIEKNEKK